MLVSSRFSLLLVLFWWGFAACASVSQAASSLEGVMRAYQERYQVVKSANKTWPANAAGEVAPVFPPDGFYARSITGPASQTAYDTLRSSITDNMFDGVNGVTTPADELMSGWLTTGNIPSISSPVAPVHLMLAPACILMRSPVSNALR